MASIRPGDHGFEASDDAGRRIHGGRVYQFAYEVGVTGSKSGGKEHGHELLDKHDMPMIFNELNVLSARLLFTLTVGIRVRVKQAQPG
jgi:hypothetical protein